jgi:hypothetical protein
MMHVGVSMPMDRLAAVSMDLVRNLDWYQHHAAMADTALGDHALGAMLDVASSTLQYGDLHAAFMIEMDVQGCMRHVVMMVKCLNEPLGEIAGFVVIDVDDSGDAIPVLMVVPFCLLHSRSGKVPDRLRTVLIAAQLNNSIEVGHEIVVESDGDALHRELTL